MKTYLVTNIDYDFDDEIVDLPTEFKIKVPNNVDDIYDYISNEISDLTGFCVNCFDTTMKTIKITKKEINKLVRVQRIRNKHTFNGEFGGYIFSGNTIDNYMYISQEYGKGCKKQFDCFSKSDFVNKIYETVNNI